MAVKIGVVYYRWVKGKTEISERQRPDQLRLPGRQALSAALRQRGGACQKARETFGTVIVLSNGANALELGFVETYNVDAALWIGDPGISGFPAVAQILNGTINPSGRLVDTFAYEATSAPSWQNFGDAQFTNSPVIIAEGFSGTTEEVFHYVDYVEGIYVGYRWYETAAAEGYIDYDKTVQYPCGYGLVKDFRRYKKQKAGK